MRTAHETQDEKIVIIGAGQAGFAAAAKLRALGHAGSITIVGDEPLLPYQRPPLSKAYVLGQMERDRLFFRPQSFFSEQNIELILGGGATAIDPASHTVRLHDGQQLAYDIAILATGSEVRRMPEAMGGSLDGLYYVRTLEDADRMGKALQPGRRALVIGGGYVGLEAAATAAKLGLTVTLVEAADRILQRVAAPETSDYFRELHREHGVTIIEGKGISRLEGTDGHVSKAVLSDGQEIPVDFVIVGIGILPRTALAEAAGIAIENGVRADEFGRTSDPSIFAVGDCASFPYRGVRLRLESVGHAIDHAERAAEIIMGAETPYHAKPWFWSDQFDCKLQIAGLNVGYDRVVVRPGSQPNAASHWYYKGDELLAVDAMNEPRAFMVGKRMLEAGKSLDPAKVGDPSVDFKALMA